MEPYAGLTEDVRDALLAAPESERSLLELRLAWPALGGLALREIPFRVGTLGAVAMAALAVAAVVHVFLNHGLLLGRLMLVPPVEAGQPGRATGRHIPLLFFADLGYATLGLLIAALWGGGPC